MSLIEPAVLRNAEAIGRQFETATPFRHATIPGFLRNDLCERLLADFPGFDSRHALNEMGEVGGKAVRMNVRDISDAYRELDAYIQSDEFLQFVSRATGIPDLLYDPDYIGGGTHENLDGQGLDVHIDFNYHPRTRWHRRLNLIVYLNPCWEGEWGGDLELHANPWSDRDSGTTAISPAFNCCAIFETTESSWHGFSQINLPDGASTRSRKSFAIYLYTRERPVEQTAPPHATVPQSLPADLQVGRVLDELDLQVLRQRFTRMRTQLRYLYDREKQFGAQIATLEQALEEMRAGQRLEIQGFATQPAGASGLWPDGWAAAELVASFVATRPAKSLRLEVWSPPKLGLAQELRIEIDGRIHTQHLRPGMRTPIELPVRLRAGAEASLRVQAARTWTPAAQGDSGDQRALAYKLLQVVLD